MNLFYRREKKPMATKLNMMRCLQQAQGLVEVAWRCPRPQPPGWFLVAVRSSHATARRQLNVWIDVQNPSAGPYAVKITHVKETAQSTALPG